ncbi:mannitol dehydrogenase family protein [bacterium]|nr:mannitol dehydrogenase family protein [bacterium]
MVTLTRAGLKDPKWKETGVSLPQFDIEEMIRSTKETPTWIHIAPGNLYAAEIAPIQQALLESGEVKEGIIGIETWDEEIVDKIYHPKDNLRISIEMCSSGENQIKLIASTADALYADTSRQEQWNKTLEYFAKPSLQMVSVTCTEKGYSTHDTQGNVYPVILEDVKNGPKKVTHLMSKIASFAYHRYKNGAAPIAFVSMDNCSKNGEKLFNAVSFIVKEWVYTTKLVEKEFLRYLESEKVSFPWTMIDRITPRPSPENIELLKSKGIEDMDIIKTSKGTFAAPFVNTEPISYLVIDDNFPNQRPPLEKADQSKNRVILVDNSEAVDKCEKMKLGTCLNPIHTTLAIFGCLLGYDYIFQEMNDPLLKELVYRQAYEEGLPVVDNPGVINPEEFLRQILEERLVNPNIPDTPQRIATDTSQKVWVRYGDTIKAYGQDAKKLRYIPFAIAGWCRYLLGVDDRGKPFELSPDPMLKELKKHIIGIDLGKPESLENKLRPVLSNTKIFGLDFYSVGLGGKTEKYFRKMITGPGAVRRTLQSILEEKRI